MLKVLVISAILLGLAMAGLGIKLLIDRKAEFRGGSCSASDPGFKKDGMQCGCGSGFCQSAAD